jgi:protein TonB
MFEDATFESTNRIRTRSRGWMAAAFCFNGSILLAMILIPLIYPEALTGIGVPMLVEAPPPPPQPRPVRSQPVHPLHGNTEIPDGHLTAPRTIPPLIAVFQGPEDAPVGGIGIDSGIQGAVGSGPSPFAGGGAAPRVRPEVKGPVRVPSSMIAGLLIRKTTPAYPPIARAARQEGTVVLQATISKEGTIENLRVVEGPQLLRQAALDAVRSWLYTPYKLNGEPVEVETTVNVVFRLAN